MKTLRVLIVFFTALLCSCNGGEPSPRYVYNLNPIFSWGKSEFFGAYYPGISSNTLSLSLYSDSLKLNINNELEGVGQCLLIEDVFVPIADSELAVGKYTASENGESFSFYTQKTPSVASSPYPFATIFYYEKNPSKSIKKFITEGSFTVSKIGDRYTVLCDFKTLDKSSIKCTFSGVLSTLNKSKVPCSQRSVFPKVFSGFDTNR